MPAFPRLLAPIVACAALAAASTGCSTVTHGPRSSRTTSADVTAREAGGPSVDELRAREAPTPLKDYRVRAADGAIELHVKASATPTTKHKKLSDGTAYSLVTFPLGNDIEATCQANAGALDLAHWVEAVLDGTHTTLSEAPRVDVEIVEGHPLMLVHVEGLVREGEVTKRHIAKFALVHLDRGSVACVHDAVGFEATFRDFARHMARTTKTPNAERPAFHAISIARDGDKVLGFEEVRTYPGPKPGEQRQIAVSSALFGNDEGWVTSDTGWFGLVDGKGVVHERAVDRTGKRVDYDMTLDRKSPGTFTYEGTVNGEAKKGSFAVKEPLVTNLSRAKAVAAFARDEKRKQLVLHHFDEHVPEAAVREVVTRGASGQLVMEDRGRTFRCDVDPSGLCTKIWREGTSTVLQRAYVAGSL